MEGQETKQITVLIAGRPYRLKIKEGDEPTIRRIVKEVNEKINRFKCFREFIIKRFSNTLEYGIELDFLWMVYLNFCVSAFL